MGNSSDRQSRQPGGGPSRQICLGILAHVDAGKTTLAESMLYLTGSIRTPGRVDHKDAFLDTEELEKDRGITIFSKQALFSVGDLQVTLMDTPGHVDFSAEMERVLSVLDYAVLVISGADGVQGHVETLWRLLDRYQIPAFLFVNKMDQPGTDRERLLSELQERLSERCVEFGGDEESEAFLEAAAMCGEEALEEYLETGRLSVERIASMILERKIFPCYFGSALKVFGVEELLAGFSRYIREPAYPEAFGARVFKIARDAKGNRLTYLKVTGGTLKVRDTLRGGGREPWEEKVNQIRLYSGAAFRTVNEARAGCVCAVTGLTRTRAGEGLGAESGAEKPVLAPVLTYQILPPPECDIPAVLGKLRQLEEEIPELHIVWNERLGEIHAQVMGEVQIEILKSLIRERFGLAVEFGSGNIVYKETIADTVEGVGHFEPLRHYAEVHLILEPGEPGSGFAADTVCSEDELDGNWQRLILTHLEERLHPGVLTGSEITDIRVTLTAGRAHVKHTEGGDFRQATYRAVRQGLRQARSVLLEPVYAFRLELPSEMTGRALTDIQRMHGRFQTPETVGERTVITGNAPVARMQEYQREVSAYTRGRGHLSLELSGYEPCHNAEEVIEALGYDPEADTENPTGSVFCAHGAGFVVPWDQVGAYMHLESTLPAWQKAHAANPAYIRCMAELPEQSAARAAAGASADSSGVPGKRTPGRSSYPASLAEDKELEEIFTRTYGPVKRRIGEPATAPRRVSAPSGPRPGGRSGKKTEPAEEYLLVDGYNVIFAWEDLKELAKVSMEGARGVLMDVLSNYQGYKKNTVILVFDAYRVKDGQGSVQRYHNIHVVFTKEAETADQYIEKTVHRIGRNGRVTVATSDGVEQVIIMGQGAIRMSARDLRSEVESVSREIREHFIDRHPLMRNYLLDAAKKDAKSLLHMAEKDAKKQPDAAGKDAEKSPVNGKSRKRNLS